MRLHTLNITLLAGLSFLLGSEPCIPGEFPISGIPVSITPWWDHTESDVPPNVPNTPDVYQEVISNEWGFAGLKTNGTINGWGTPASVNTQPFEAPSDAGYTAIFSSGQAFAALKEDGSISAWGKLLFENASTGAPSDGGYTSIVSNIGAFAARKADGSISAWGSPEHGGTGAPSDAGYTAIVSSGQAFAARKADGSISAWGLLSADVRVSSGLDDAEEHTTEGNAMDLISSDLELGADAGAGDLQDIGIRFQNITVPAGATILNASIQFTVDEADDEPTSLLIYGELSTDPAEYGNAARSISSRSRTTAFVEWNDIPAWDDASIGSAGPDQRTPDLSPIVQEIVSQEGWGGGAMAFMIVPNTEDPAMGGERTAEAFDGVEASAPLLHIEYFPQAPSDTGYTDIFSNSGAFAALGADGAISAWGSPEHGGSGAPGDTGYTDIFSNGHAFAALGADGSISAWGSSEHGGTGEPDGLNSEFSTDFIWILPSGTTFMAFRPADNSVNDPPTSPEINVVGNTQNIADSTSHTPATSDDTDFGSVDTASGSDVHTFTIQNTGTGSLSVGTI
ncbi:MAG: hypothetical protein P8L18_05095, partial [Verrucomicrobiota bacterium]|nr:hypothetical protein [Verrucomicrobiota bacterium]